MPELCKLFLFIIPYDLDFYFRDFLFDGHLVQQFCTFYLSYFKLILFRHRKELMLSACLPLVWPALCSDITWH